MSGGDHPPQACYEKWAQLNNVSIPWASLNTGQQANWALIAQAAINAQ